MKTSGSYFDEHEALHELKHFLPAQAPLKDFVHHNTLHAFQHLKFHQGIRQASEMFGYRVYPSLAEFRALYKEKRIHPTILKKIISERKGPEHVNDWMEKLLHKVYQQPASPRIGQLRANWKKQYQIDLDSLVHPGLFRILCSYLDQGISMWRFPVSHQGFLASLKELERKSFTSFFRAERAKAIFLEGKDNLRYLLEILVGDEKFFKQYLFDQQFAHQGWSGMVSAIEAQPHVMLDTRQISLRELVIFEVLLEIDALDYHFGENQWQPLSGKLEQKPIDIFADVPETELYAVLSIWQEACEWSYYDQVLAGVQVQKKEKREPSEKSFQAMFCIDDRECSLRRYLEKTDTGSETFATPGFFGVEFYFQPEHGKFYTKQCPVPVTPKYLIKEVGKKEKRKKDAHFAKHTHSLFRGWIISQTLGFWSAFRLFLNIFRPSMSPATAHSFDHMDKSSRLTIENKDPEHQENGLQVGFTVEEMAQRVETLLRSIGLVKNFAPLVYVIGHGSSSVNNPHYAAYDCGACSGRPGSVNARVFSFMANHPKVRGILSLRGIDIPAETQFMGGLHDTTRDEILFFDEDQLSSSNKERHRNNEAVFTQALDLNAKERARKFESIDKNLSPEKVHQKIRLRSVSLFEPRPELNHATNALCIVGRRGLTKDLFLDRRAFLNSYDYQVDPSGKSLLSILKAAAPVCGGINLEYYFSRVDNQKLGAGTKLPHNVMGLFGVANGIDGDLRPGLPSQMIELHDPVRMLFIVEHFPDVVLEILQSSADTYEWFVNEWVHLVVAHPENHGLYLFKHGKFTLYDPLASKVDVIPDMLPLLSSHQENLPVYLLS